MSQEMKRILVTGGAGFIGSSLCEELAQQGHSLVVLDNYWRGKRENLESISTLSNVKIIQGDCRDSEVLAQAVDAFSGLDIIVHLAAVNGTKWFHKEARSVIDVNINGTLRTLELAESCNARYVLASSPEAFGEAEIQPISNGNPMTFSDPAKHQRHSYGASKYLDEVACQHAVRSGLDVRIIRPFNAYGPRLLGDEYGQVVAMFFDAVMNSKAIQIHGDGLQTRSFTWIDDLVAGVLAAMFDEGIASGSAFNLGSCEEVTIGELAKMVVDVVEQSGWQGELPAIEYSQGYHGDSKRRLPDIDETREVLGFSAPTSLRQGLELMWKQLSTQP